MNRIRCCSGLTALAVTLLAAAPEWAQKEGLAGLTSKDFQDAVAKEIGRQRGLEEGDRSKPFQAADSFFVLNESTAARIDYDPGTMTLTWRCPLKPGAAADKDAAADILRNFLEDALQASKLVARVEKRTG